MSDNYLRKELLNLIHADQTIFNFILDACLDGLWYWDLEKPENEWMDDHFWQTFGYDPKEKKHFASEWQAIIFPEDLTLLLNSLEKHCQNPDYPYDQEVRFHHQNGSTVWIRCRGIAIRDAAGKPIRMLGAHSNITRQKEMEHRFQRNLKEMDKAYATTKIALEESEQLFQMAPDANLKVAISGDITKANIRASELFGYSQAELTNMSVTDLIPHAYRPNHDSNISAYFQLGGARKMGSERGRLTALRKDGSFISVEITLNLIESTYGKHALATIRDVTEREELISTLRKQVEENAKLQTLTLIDPLTKIYNTRHFRKTIEKEYHHACRHKQALSLLIFDIDYFKNINDQYGHNCGNDVLIELTERLQGLLRFGDTFSRIGGEEFAIILPHTEIESAMVVADRILFELEGHRFKLSGYDNKELRVTVSIGLTCLLDHDDSGTDLIDRADKAMYQSKAQGRDRVTCYPDINIPPR